MFKSARIKLTVWYLLIIASISFLFSFTIFRFLNNEIDRFSDAQKIRLERRIERRFPDEVIRKFPAPPPDFSDPDIVKETKTRILFALLGVNGIIIVISGFLSYFLSGKTLQPIKETFEQQDKFISDASHELKTPLTSLRTSIEVALRSRDLNLDESKKVLRECLEDVDSLSTLANSLLEISRAETKKEQLILVKITAKEILNTAIKAVIKQAKFKEISIVKKIGNTKIIVDKEKTERVLIVVLDNAVKFSPPNSSISISTSKSARYFTFCITDQGVGISEQDKPKIFNRFFRSDISRTNSPVNGFGLGLSIARSIVDLHGGKIFVKSTQNKGSSFYIKFPLLQSKFSQKK